MTPEQAAHDTAAIVAGLPARFVTAPATLARGAELGLGGADFYYAGRAGPLGDVPADVVAAVFVFFAPDTVADVWERTGKVLARAEAAREWAAAAHRWARAHLPADAELDDWLGRIVRHASSAGAPLFGAWRTLPEPDDVPARLWHRCNLLRELRGALHAAAVLTVGLSPHEAVMVRAPKFLPVYGWQPPHPDPEPCRERWALAEARTDRMVGRHLAVLDAAERAAFVERLPSIA